MYMYLKTISAIFTEKYVHSKGIVGAVVIFDHGLKFGIIFLVSDPSHEKLIASKKKFITIE